MTAARDGSPTDAPRSPQATPPGCPGGRSGPRRDIDGSQADDEFEVAVLLLVDRLRPFQEQRIGEVSAKERCRARHRRARRERHVHSAGEVPLPGVNSPLNSRRRAATFFQSVSAACIRLFYRSAPPRPQTACLREGCREVPVAECQFGCVLLATLSSGPNGLAPVRHHADPAGYPEEFAALGKGRSSPAVGMPHPAVWEAGGETTS